MNLVDTTPSLEQVDVNALIAHSRRHTVPWYDYIASFFAGMFLTNVVPHFVHGISGDPFPTPFSRPPGKGLSSPTVNVVWALIFFAGIVVIGIMGSRSFATKHTR